MSRRIPPTPVAAPWYGSTADGWLCDSILNATASPSPIEMTPGVLARTRDHALTGGRERPEQRLRALVRAVLAPHDAEHRELEIVRVTSAEAVADGVELVVGHAETAMERLHGSLGHGHRDPAATAGSLAARAALSTSERMIAEAVVRAEERLRCPFRMRHEPRHVARGVHDPGDRAQRAVRVRGVVRPRGLPRPADVPEQHLAVGLERVERRVIRVEPAFAVRDRHPQRSMRGQRVGEPRVEPFGGDRDLLAREPERGVAEQRARHETGLREDLEAVADAQHEPAVGRERAHGAHDRAEPGDDSGPDVVAVGEATRQDDRGDALERGLLVPQDDRVGAGEMEGMDRVAVAVAAREDDDPDPDRHR